MPSKSERDDAINWSGNLRYGARECLYPESVDEVRQIVARSPRIKALGARHSFTDIADTSGSLISLARMPRILEIDSVASTVTIDAGLRYGDLGPVLHSAGLALHNTASLPHITVAGACATATHGSGDRNGCLAAAVRSLEMVTAAGDVITLDRADSEFHGAVVGLGALGIITRITLNAGRSVPFAQDVYENLPFAQLEDRLDALMASAYSVSLFTNWRDNVINQIWLKRRSGDPQPESLWEATAAGRNLHPIDGPATSTGNCTPQMGEYGPWHERLPHFLLAGTPSCGDELQTEYLVPRKSAAPAIRAFAAMANRIAPLVQVSEIRSVAADDFWMSPFCGEDCICIHSTWWNREAEVRRLLPEIDAALAPFNARPHWAKLSSTPQSRLERLYSKLPDFRRLAATFDPGGKFRNRFLDALLDGSDSGRLAR